MDKAFAHKEKCGCEYCNSGRNIVKIILTKKETINVN